MLIDGEDAVPRFFIHLRSGEDLQRDDCGQEYASEQAALHAATRSAGLILSDDLGAGNAAPSLALHVERADGTMLATIEVSATVTRP